MIAAMASGHPEESEPGAEDVAVAGLDREERGIWCHARIIQRAAARGKRNQTVPLRCSPVIRRTVPAARPHDDAFGGDAAVLQALDPVEQGAVGDPGRGEDAVAARHVLERVDAVQILDSPAMGAGALVVVAEQQAALDLPADAAQGGRGEHALGGAARPHVDVDRGVGIGGGDDPGDVAVGDQHDAAAERAQLGDQLGVARPVEHAGDQLVRIDALGLGDRADIVGRRPVEADHALGA